MIQMTSARKPESIRSYRDCVETRFAAVPPDVRKGCALPARVDGTRGYAQLRGVAPE